MVNLEQNFLKNLHTYWDSLSSTAQGALRKVLKMVSDARSLKEKIGHQMQAENEVGVIRRQIFKIILKILGTEPLSPETDQLRAQVSSLLKHEKTHIDPKDMSISELYIEGDPSEVARIVKTLEKHYDIKTVADLRRLQENYSRYLELGSKKRDRLDKALEEIGFPPPKRKD